MARLYGQKFKHKNVNFVSELSGVTKPDICLISCTLQYLEEPEDLIAKVLDITDRLIILRHCETEFLRDRYAIQKICEPEVELSWPIRFFRKGWLVDQLATKHKIVGQFEMMEENNLDGVNVKLSSFAILREALSPNASAAINN